MLKKIFILFLIFLIYENETSILRDKFNKNYLSFNPEKMIKKSPIYRIFAINNAANRRRPYLPPFLMPVLRQPSPTPQHFQIKLFGMTRLPPILEFLLQRVQSYFSVYIYEDLSRPPTWDSPSQQLVQSIGEMSKPEEDPIYSNLSSIVINYDQNKQNITLITNDEMILNILNETQIPPENNITVLYDKNQNMDSTSLNLDVTSPTLILNTDNSLDKKNMTMEMNQIEPRKNVTRVFVFANGKFHDDKISILKYNKRKSKL